MDPDNAVPLSGSSYLWSYPGGLNLVELILDVTVVIFMIVSGFSFKAYIFSGITVLAAIESATFLILHMKSVITRSKLKWHWIECISVLSTAILMAIFSSVILSVFTKGYIFTGVMGYLTSMVYFFDTFHKYQVAVTPVPKYAWTTPNMPELN